MQIFLDIIPAYVYVNMREAKMSKLTITEALAEIKTIGNRIQKKREFIAQYISRPETVRDPLDKEGGAEKLVGEAVQSIKDLCVRIVNLRHAIQCANMSTMLSIDGQSQTIAEWLVWRRDVSKILSEFWNDLGTKVSQHHYQMANAVKTLEVVSAVIMYPANKVAQEQEHIQKVLGELDGQLSLKNATVFIELNG